MEKLNFESDPEKEGTIEKRIAKAFKEFASIDLGEDAVVFESYLSKELPGASVKKIFKAQDYTKRDHYFEEVSGNTQDIYFKVEFGGRSYLLPKPLKRNTSLQYGYSERQKRELSFDLNDVKPIPLKSSEKGFLVADIPEETVDNFEITPDQDKKAKDQLFVFYDLADRMRKVGLKKGKCLPDDENRNAVLEKEAEDMWSNVKPAIASREDFEEILAQWFKDCEGMEKQLASVEKDSKGSGDEKTTVSVSLEQKVERKDLPNAELADSRLEADPSVVHDGVNVSTEVPVESGGAKEDFENRKQEAYGLFIEFSTLLIEYQRLNGEKVEDLNQSILENGFEGEVNDFKTEQDWSEYEKDLRTRIEDLRKDIEDKKRMNVGTRTDSAQHGSVASELVAEAEGGNVGEVAEMGKTEVPKSNVDKYPGETISLSELPDVPSFEHGESSADHSELGVGGNKVKGDEVDTLPSGARPVEERPEVGVRKPKHELKIKVEGDFYGRVDFSGLESEHSAYWKVLESYVENFIDRSIDKIGFESRDYVVRCLTRLVALHNRVFFPGMVEGLDKLENWTSFRKEKLDSLKCNEGTFGDFEIVPSDLEYVLNESRKLLDKKIREAKETAEKSESHSDPLPVSEPSPTPLMDTSSEKKLTTPSWSGKPSVSVGEFRRELKEILGEGGGKSKTGSFKLGSSDSAREEEKRGGSLGESSDGRVERFAVRKIDDVPVRQHNWRSNLGNIVVVAGIALGGLSLYKMTKKESVGEKVGDVTPSAEKVVDGLVSSNKVESVKPLRPPLLELEKSMTNFVSPEYLARIKQADYVVSSNAVPVFSGFEQISSNLTDHLKFIWNDDNGTYPRGWIYGKFGGVNYSTNPQDVDANNFRVVGEFDGGTSKVLNLYTNSNFYSKFAGNTNLSFVPVNALDGVFSHELAHANDWLSQNFAYLERAEGGLSEKDERLRNDPDYRYEKRLVLLGKVLERVISPDRARFESVEDIKIGGNEGREMMAEEYWAEVCEMYFNQPSKLKSNYPKDWELVDGFVQEMDPGFNPEAAKEARYHLGRWFENGQDGVILEKGGKTNWEDFRKKVRYGLKGYGGKTRHFDARTEIPKK